MRMMSSPSRHAPFWSPPARGPTPCLRASTRPSSASMASTSRPSTTRAGRSSPSAAPSRRRSRCCRACAAMAAPSPSSAICIHPLPATWLRPWRAPSRAGRPWPACSSSCHPGRPGEFYRLQNFETLAHRIDGTTLAMEGLAMTGAWVDAERGLVSVIALEMGGSSDLCALLKPGDPVILMGPTGHPTETPAGETVLLAGGGLGNAVLFSIGRALRAAGSKVLYFAGYKRVEDRYKVAEIEAAADVVVWACDEAPGFKPGRPQDCSNVGNIIDTMVAYQRGKLGPKSIDLRE